MWSWVQSLTSAYEKTYIVRYQSLKWISVFRRISFWLSTEGYLFHQKKKCVCDNAKWAAVVMLQQKVSASATVRSKQVGIKFVAAAKTSPLWSRYIMPILVPTPCLTEASKLTFMKPSTVNWNKALFCYAWL